MQDTTKIRLGVFVLFLLLITVLAVVWNRPKHRFITTPPSLSLGINDKELVVSTKTTPGQAVAPGYTMQGARGEEYIGQMIIILPNIRGGVTAIEPKMLLPGNWVAGNNDVWTWDDVIFIGSQQLSIEIIISASFDKKANQYEYDRYICRTKTQGIMLWHNTWTGVQIECIPKT